ncbi:MAG: T9SS type A sorting domain-containing protein [Bacteroidales bacterium]|nr:T9SS type A sorting domain-containing protein [Bacteroidales bacterium]
MKKVIVTLMLIVASLNVSLAQNYVVRSIENIQNGEYLDFCGDEYDGIIIYGRSGCQNEWTVDNLGYFIADSIVLDNTNVNLYEGVGITHLACLQYTVFFVQFWDSYIENPFPEPVIWKRQGETVKLGNEYPGIYEYLWSNDSTNCEIEVIEPGIYSVTMNQIYGCGSETFSVEVRDNVEIYRSGVDPATNKNRVLWQTTPTQAEYISNVKVERDGMVVGTVPYTDGQFLDNIGSENAARIYRITGIASDGTECPLPSYQFGTFNTIISPDIANPSLMNFTWEDPFIEEGSPYSIVAYRIGRFNEATGEFIAIDQVSAQVHIAKYNMDLFDGDYGLVAAVFNDVKNRDYEELAFSNRSDSGIVGIGEQNGETFGIYPNPAKDRFTVEGTGTMTVMNTLGQTVMTKEIDGKTTIELPQGMYFVKLGGAMRKAVVE